MTLQRRAALTLALLAFYAIASRLTLPGIDSAAVGLGVHLSVLELGIAPALAAYLWVELLAALIPRWRKLRVSGPGPRRKLVQAARILTLVMAGFQAFAVGLMLENMSVLALEGELTTTSPVIPALALVAGAGVTLAIAETVTRLGLVNGFVVLLMWGTVNNLLNSRTASYASSSMPVASGVVFLLLPILGTWLCLGSDPRKTATSALPRPGSSLYPLSLAGALLAAPVLLGNLWDGSLEWLGISQDWVSLSYDALATPLWLVALTCLFGAALARAFSYPEEWRPALRRLSFEPAQANRLIRRAWRDALWETVLYLIVLAACEHGIRRVFGAQGLAYSLALGTALVIDLVRALGMYTTGAWLPVWPEPRAHLLPLAGVYLEQQGIAARTSSFAQGVLLRFFGPYALPALCVHPENAKRAKRLLADFLRTKRPVPEPPLPDPHADADSEPPASAAPEPRLIFQLGVLAAVATFAAFVTG